MSTHHIATIAGVTVATLLVLKWTGLGATLGLSI
jgi:hypothetical protein